MPPMTFIVLLLIVAGLFGGCYLFWKARWRGGRADAVVCQRCQAGNPANAKYCAHCGEPLDG